MIRVGITQRVEKEPTYEEWRDCLDQNWIALLLSIGIVPIPLFNKVNEPDAYLTALDLQGVILSGGSDFNEQSGVATPKATRDKFELQLLDFAEKHGLPVLGVCRGMQVLTVAQGGTLTTIDQHVAQRHNVSLDVDEFLSWPKNLEVNSYHNNAIRLDGIAPGFEPIAFAEDGTIEAMADENLRRVGIMWHPEREDQFRAWDKELFLKLFVDQPWNNIKLEQRF